MLNDQEFDKSLNPLNESMDVDSLNVDDFSGDDEFDDEEVNDEICPHCGQDYDRYPDGDPDNVPQCCYEAQEEWKKEKLEDAVDGY